MSCVAHPNHNVFGCEACDETDFRTRPRDSDLCAEKDFSPWRNTAPRIGPTYLVLVPEKRP